MSTKPKNTVDYKEGLYERLRNQQYAEGYLQAAYEEYEEDRDFQAFLLCLGDVVKANGMSKLLKIQG